MNQNDKYIGIAEVANRLGVSKDTIYKLIRTKELKGIRIGNVFKVKESDLAVFISAHEV